MLLIAKVRLRLCIYSRIQIFRVKNRDKKGHLNFVSSVFEYQNFELKQDFDLGMRMTQGR